MLGRRLGDVFHIHEIAFSANTAGGDRRSAFEIDPSLYIDLHKVARAGGADVIGVWHSHPSGRAEPSETDKACSVEAGWIWLITAAVADKCETRAFCTDDKNPQLFQGVEMATVS